VNQFPPSQGLPVQPAPRPVSVKLTLPPPRLTYVILGLTVVVYLLQMWTNFSLGYDLPAALGAKVNDLILAGQWWRLLTPVLLHGSLVHIGMNMYALFVLGPSLERRYGYGRFLLLYVLTAFSGNVFSFLLTKNPSLGASTALFGLFAAQGIFLWQNRSLLRGARGELGNLAQVLVLNLALGIFVPGIDLWGHVGGLLGGAIYAWFAGPKWQLVETGAGAEVIDTCGWAGKLLGAVAVIVIFAILVLFKMMTS
jgi:rhomboid protease GluP